jgi:hypothetical protein
MDTSRPVTPATNDPRIDSVMDVPNYHAMDFDSVHREIVLTEKDYV